MGLFEKKKKVFSVRGDKALWQRAREALTAAGIRPAQAGSYDPNPVCGCGAHLDPRDFGGGGKPDRNEYFIYVKEADAPRAEELLSALEGTP